MTRTELSPHERELEDAIVEDPSIVAEGLRIIGRQLRTATGPLDLLGVDENGALVVIELKRDDVVRRYIAQALDYWSYVKSLSSDDLARFIERSSGHRGVERINDFKVWFRERFPRARKKPVRIMIVGVGADHSAVRIVSQLASAGIPIEIVACEATRRRGKVSFRRSGTVDSPPAKQTAAAKKLDLAWEKIDALPCAELYQTLHKTVLEVFPEAVEEARSTAAIAFKLKMIDLKGKQRLRDFFVVRADEKRAGKSAGIWLGPPTIQHLPPDVPPLGNYDLGGRLHVWRGQKLKTGERLPQAWIDVNSLTDWRKCEEDITDLLHFIRGSWYWERQLWDWTTLFKNGEFSNIPD